MDLFETSFAETSKTVTVIVTVLFSDHVYATSSLGFGAGFDTKEDFDYPDV